MLMRSMAAALAARAKRDAWTRRSFRPAVPHISRRTVYVYKRRLDASRYISWCFWLAGRDPWKGFGPGRPYRAGPQKVSGLTLVIDCVAPHRWNRDRFLQRISNRYGHLGPS